MNTFYNALNNKTNLTRTENGALAHSSTGSAVYDLFALGAAMRGRNASDIIDIFAKAYDEDKTLALRCLFYIRDARFGQGERNFFRVCMKWLAEHDEPVAREMVKWFSTYGRYDDLFCLWDTNVRPKIVETITFQLLEDLDPQNAPSLLAKWLPSENASSRATRNLAREVARALTLNPRAYRKMLSALRARINIVERLLSEKRYSAIDFKTIPGQAMQKYRKAFMSRPELAARFKEFIENKNTKINASTLTPFDIVHKADAEYRLPSREEREYAQKAWTSLPDYFNGHASDMICVVDTSGSMTSTMKNSSATALEAAMSLGIYTAEHLAVPFKNSIISFSDHPKFIKFGGYDDIVDKIKTVYRNAEVASTNLTGVFDLLYNTARTPGVRPEDVPSTIVVISDMEINQGASGGWSYRTDTEMEKVRRKWAAAGLKMPRLIYWNVMARHNIILENADAPVSFVSGFSPTIFTAILTGKTGIDMMLEILNSRRYIDIHA